MRYSDLGFLGIPTFLGTNGDASRTRGRIGEIGSGRCNTMSWLSMYELWKEADASLGRYVPVTCRFGAFWGILIPSHYLARVFSLYVRISDKRAIPPDAPG